MVFNYLKFCNYFKFYRTRKVVKFVILSNITSTNNFFFSYSIFFNFNFLLVFSENQISGKGNLNNRWNSPWGLNLTFSLYFKLSYYKLSFYILFFNIFFNLIIIRILCNFLSYINFKYPNDVYELKDKVYGLLIEYHKFKGIYFFVFGLGIDLESFLFLIFIYKNDTKPVIKFSLFSRFRELVFYNCILNFIKYIF